jgi:hypothetical protein
MKTIKSILLITCFLCAFSFITYSQSLLCSSSLYTSGTVAHSDESAYHYYISHGTNINWSLTVRTFNVSPAVTTAQAKVAEDIIVGVGSATRSSQSGGPFRHDLTITNTGYYSEINDSRTGSFTYQYDSIFLYTMVSISRLNGCGGQAYAYISW